MNAIRSKIRVLLVTGSLNIGGMETVAMNIVRFSDRKTFVFDFLVYGEKEYSHEREAIQLGCRILRVPFPHDTPLSFEKNVRNIIRKNGPYQIVHCHNLFNCGFVAKAAYLEHVPVRISHSHTNRVKRAKSIIRNIYELYMRLLISKYSTDFFACSLKAGNYLFGKKFADIGFILKNGIDVDKFSFDNDVREKYRQDFSVRDKLIIGQIGTLCDVKNHLFSLEVFKKMSEKQKNRYKLIFVGDGELKDDIEFKIEELDLQGDVIMLGRRSDVSEILSMIDLYFMPSKYEGVSVALMEAQAAGLPCVTSETACAPEVNVTNQIQTVCLLSPIDEWVDKIEQGLNIGRNYNSSRYIKECGYDIRSIIKDLNKKYLASLKNQEDK